MYEGVQWDILIIPATFGLLVILGMVFFLWEARKDRRDH